MTSKKITLTLDDCYAMVNLNNDGDDVISLELVELEVDQEKSTEEVTHHKTFSATTLYLKQEDIQTLIDALNFIGSKEVF